MSSNYDNFFTPLENNTPFFKAAFQGEAGSGKTHSMAFTAIGLHKHIKSTKPIVIFDTETASKYLRRMFEQYEIPVLVKPSRTLTDLMTTIKYCDEGNADILLIDSITHIYKKLLSGYQQTKNGKKFISFEDWGIIKPIWQEGFSDNMVMSKCHIMFTGRQGYTYSYEEDEDGKKTLTKTGVKMKAEGETAYEPDLLVQMERFERVLSDEKKDIWREATVLKGRGGLIDGNVFQFRKNPENPNDYTETYEAFKPMVDYLLDGKSKELDLVSLDDSHLFDVGQSDHKDRKEAKIQLERNENLISKVAAGTTGEAKALKLALMEYAYMGETSELAIAKMSSATLLDANVRLEEMVSIISKVQRGEMRCYPVAKAVTAARTKYLDTTNLGEATPEQLQSYLDHMIKKVEEENAKKAGKAA